MEKLSRSEDADLLALTGRDAAWLRRDLDKAWTDRKDAVDGEIAMFSCHVCGHNVAKPERVREVFDIDGRRVLVEGIPALACERCREATFSRETTELIRRMVHGAARPVKTVPMDVFAIA